MMGWFASENFGWFLLSIAVLFVVLIVLLGWASARAQRAAGCGGPSAPATRPHAKKASQ